jgi:hypothetical protein
VRLLALLALPSLLPALAAAQSGDAAPLPAWAHFRRDGPPLALVEPLVFRSPWLAGDRRPGGEAASWDSALTGLLDSIRTSRIVAHRLRRLYGPRASARDEDAEGRPRERRNFLGLDPRYVDLDLDGQTRLEIRTERLKNLRCTPAQILDPNAGCRGGFKAPRLDTELQVRAAGLLGRRLHLDVDYDTQRDFTARNNIQIYYEGLDDEIVRRVEVGTVTFRPPASRFITANIPANNFGVNATFEVGPMQLQTVAATQKGSVVATRTYTIGATTVQPQDRELRDLDFESSRFFWVIDPVLIPGFPAVDILGDLSRLPLPAGVAPQPGTEVRIYRYRPSGARTGPNPSLGGITAIAIGADTTQRVTARWDLLVPGLDYYMDVSNLWFVLAARLDVNDYLAVSYRTATGLVGTYPAVDQPVPPDSQPRDTLRLIVEPRVANTRPTFRHEIRSVYRVAGSDLDVASLKVDLTLNRSSRPLRPGAQPTYLAELGLSTAADPNVFNAADRLFPRTRDATAGLTIKESYIVLPHLRPFADPARLTPTELSDSLYQTPGYLLFTEGPPAKFLFRLQYNAASSADRSTLDLGALQIRDGSEELFVNGRRLEKGVDYNINYDVGQVTFLDPPALFGTGGAVQVQARFEERGIFAVAPTQIYGLASRYRLGDVGGINLVGVYQVEQSAFNRPQLGFEAQANLVGGISTDLKFRPQGVTRFLNRFTSTPATAPSRLEFNGEVAFTRPDPNRSGQAYLEEFEGDNGIPVSLRESLWEFSSRPQYTDGVQAVVGPQFDPADAVQLTWQNLVPDGQGGTLQLRARDIDPRIQVAGQRDQLETILFMALHADTAGGIVQRDNRARWTQPQRLFAPRWRSIVTALSTTGVDLSKNEFLEFWVFQDRRHSADSAGVKLVFDLGNVSEDAVALAPDTIDVAGPPGLDTLFRGRRLIGQGRLDTERQPTGVFNAETDDIGILGDRPDSLIRADGEAPLRRFPLCRRELSNSVPVFPWGDLGSRCTNGNGFLDTEDLDGDNTLDAQGATENVFRWVVDLRQGTYFARDGVPTPDSLGGWKLYRIPLRRAEFALGTPNIRLIRHLRVTVVAEADQGGPDRVAFFALARMRLVGSPWVRRSDSPIAGLAGSTGSAAGEVIATTISTENTELGYTSPPGVVSGLDRRGGSRDEFGTQVNERSLRLIGSRLGLGQRAEAYFRFPSGPQNLLKYEELRFWARGSGAGWVEGDFQVYIRVGTDSRNFYQFIVPARTATWVPEGRVSLSTWRRLRAAIESRRLQGLPPDSAARVACGGDTVSTAYVLCEGPYLVYVQDPAVSPPNLAAVQEIAAGILRVAATTATDSAEVWVDDIRLVEPVSRVGTAVAVDGRLVASDVGDLILGFTRQDGFFQQLGAEPTYRTTSTFQAASNLRLDRFLPPSLGLLFPVQVAYVRTGVDPDLLTGTDLRGEDLDRLRRPESRTVSYNFLLRRAARGRSWLVRGLLDPLGVNVSVVDGRSLTEQSRATSRSRSILASYNLLPGRTGLSLDLGGLVAKLPGFLRRSDGADALRRPFVSLAPTSVRLSSGLVRSQSEFFAYLVPVRRPADSAIVPVTSLTHTWRNSAGLTWQPLGMLSLSADLASTRDLRVYPDSNLLGRVVNASRRSFLGMDVGVERDRQLSTSLGLSPRIASWLRPRYVRTSSFILSRSLTSRDPIRENGDTAGAFILPQTLNNSRSVERGVNLDLGRLASRILGDSGVLAKNLRRLRGFDLSDRLTRTSTFDLAAFDPGLGYQLGVGGLDRFMRQEGELARGATETRTTTFTTGADFPLGLSFSTQYSRSRSSRFQQVGGAFQLAETHQREWPKGNLRLTRTLRGGPVSLVAVGASYRHTEGTTTLPAAVGTGARTRTESRTITPDLTVSFRNGMVVTGTYAMLDQANESNGNRTEFDQNDLNLALSYGLRLPASVSRLRKVVRTSLTGVLSKGTSCLQRATDPDCVTISDIRRQELRGSFDTDLLRILTGGLTFSYSVSDARHLDRKLQQIIVTATFQLSLYAGDYR